VEAEKKNSKQAGDCGGESNFNAGSLRYSHLLNKKCQRKYRCEPDYVHEEKAGAQRFEECEAGERNYLPTHGIMVASYCGFSASIAR